MSFKVDGYIPEWLLYLDSGDAGLLERSELELRIDDSVTGSGFIQFAEAISLLVNVISMPLLCERLACFLRARAGQMILSFIRGEPSYFRAPDANTAGLLISHSDNTILAWTMVLHVQSENAYGAISTFRPLHRLAHALTLDYLNQSPVHLKRKKIFRDLGDEALSQDSFYRQVAGSVHDCVTTKDGPFHDAVISSQMGFAGLIEAGINLSKYFEKISPCITTGRFKKPAHLKRSLQIYAELMVNRSDMSPWKHFIKLLERCDYPNTPQVEMALKDFFVRSFEAQNQSFQTWATTLTAFVGKPQVIEALFHRPLFLSRLQGLDPSVMISLFHGSRMKNQMLQRYPEHIDASFSRDLGL